MLSKAPYGKLPDGREVSLYSLKNRQGACLDFIDYGGIVTRLEAPDKAGRLQDVLLGYENLEGWLDNSQYMNAIIGRVANRIGKARFTLEGREVRLTANQGQNQLHGGKQGFDKRLWRAEPVEHKDGPAVLLRYHSADGEEGYPGAVEVDCLYVWTDENEFRIEYGAVSDRTTVLSLTHHCYFNLKDGGASSSEGHELRIAASRITEVDAESIPTGKIRDVAGGPFDFRKSMPVGLRINEKDEQLANGEGYDHNFLLDDAGGAMKLGATLYDPQSGRVMDVLTTEPAVQFYAGNQLGKAGIKGKGGLLYGLRHGLCLEPGRYHDAPNHPAFPSIVLKPGERYRHVLAYKFSAR